MEGLKAIAFIIVFLIMIFCLPIGTLALIFLLLFINAGD